MDGVHGHLMVDHVVDELEVVAQLLQGGTQGGGTGLLGSGDNLAVLLSPAAQAPQQHGNMAEFIGDTDDGVGGDPAADAQDQHVEGTGLQLCHSGIGGLILGIVDDQTCVDDVAVVEGDGLQRHVMLFPQLFDGGVDLTQGHKSNDLLTFHNSIPPEYKCLCFWFHFLRFK